MKKSFWKSDWFAGLVISLLFLLAGSSAMLQSLERIAYDWGIQASSRDAGDLLSIIAIDEQSIANIGRWPWSRNVHAEMTDLLAKAEAKVIGNTIFFTEPQIDPGLAHINKISEFVQQAGSRQTAQAVPLVLAHYDQYYPSLSMQIAAKHLNLQPQDIEKRYARGTEIAADIRRCLVQAG